MFSYSLCIIIPIIIVAYIANSIYVKSIREQTSINIHGTLQQITDNVTYKLDDAIRITDMLYYDTKFIQSLQIYDDDWDNYDKLVNYLLPKLHDTVKAANSHHLLDIYFHNPTLPEVYYIRSKAEPYFWATGHFDLYHSYRIRDKAWYMEFPPEEYGETMQWKQIEDDKEYQLLSLMRRIVNVNSFRETEEIGFIRLSFKLDELFQSVDFKKIGDGSSIFIMGEQDEIIYHSGTEMILSEALASERLLKDYILIKEVLPYLDWNLVTLVPTDIIEKDVIKVRIITLIVCVICAIVFFLIAASLSGFVTKRVAKIVSVLRSFREGEFHKRMKYSGNNEFGIIASALNNMGENMESLIQEVYLSNIQKKEAELESLQAQINPHFLYNTLSSISSLAKFGEVDKLNRMVIDLSKFYRLSLNEGRNVILMSEELAQAQAYINIQTTKYGDRITVIYHIDPNLLPLYTIKLILQPMIENVFEHAWADDQIHMRIVATYEKDIVTIKIIDNGGGIHPDIIRQIHSPNENLNIGYGIRNVDQRIKLHYGKKYRINPLNLDTYSLNFFYS